MFYIELCLRKPSSATELRRKQTTAVVLLGVIGAEFGQEVGSVTNRNGSRKLEDRRKSSVVEGFGVGNNDLARLTSSCNLNNQKLRSIIRNNFFIFYFCLAKVWH